MKDINDALIKPLAIPIDVPPFHYHKHLFTVPATPFWSAKSIDIDIDLSDDQVADGLEKIASVLGGGNVDISPDPFDIYLPDPVALGKALTPAQIFELSKKAVDFDPESRSTEGDGFHAGSILDYIGALLVAGRESGGKDNKFDEYLTKFSQIYDFVELVEATDQAIETFRSTEGGSLSLGDEGFKYSLLPTDSQEVSGNTSSIDETSNDGSVLAAGSPEGGTGNGLSFPILEDPLAVLNMFLPGKSSEPIDLVEYRLPEVKITDIQIPGPNSYIRIPIWIFNVLIQGEFGFELNNIALGYDTSGLQEIINNIKTSRYFDAISNIFTGSGTYLLDNDAGGNDVPEFGFSFGINGGPGVGWNGFEAGSVFPISVNIDYNLNDFLGGSGKSDGKVYLSEIAAVPGIENALVSPFPDALKEVFDISLSSDLSIDMFWKIGPWTPTLHIWDTKLFEKEINPRDGAPLPDLFSVGGPEDDQFVGDDRNNTYYGNGGADVIAGGGGDDELWGEIGPRVTSLAGEAGSDAIFGEEGHDRLYGGDAGDLLVGGDENDELHGEDGDDGGEDRGLFGGPGDDKLYGEDDDDFLNGGPGADLLDGGPGFDTADYYDSPAPVTLLLEGTDERGVGDVADTANRPAGVNGGDAEGDTLTSIDKYSGSNVATGFAHDDLVFGFDGGTSADLWGGNDIFDNREAATGVDRIAGGEGGDTIRSGGGGDELYGEGGNDTLDGEAGDDHLDGGSGWDVYQVAGRDDGYDHYLDSGEPSERAVDVIVALESDTWIGMRSIGGIERIMAAPPEVGIQRVSVDSAGNQADGGFGAEISADGRFVAFTGIASNLVPGDTNGREDVFVHDRLTGTTERVSVDSDGNQGDGSSLYSSISADGRFVAFMSVASNLVPGDTNGLEDIFVHDRLTGTTERVSVDSDGNQGNGSSQFFGSISADGRFVVFQSWASNLVPGVTSLYLRVFVHDRLTGTTELVSVDSAGNQGTGTSSFDSISADGRFVAFTGIASNLVPDDTNGRQDVFVHDRLTGTTERVSVDSDGNQGALGSIPSEISADGRFVAFMSGASNLVPGDTNGQNDVFVHDRLTGTTERVSADSAGNQGNSTSHSGSISADGRFVAFQSWASNLVPGDTNGQVDIFVHDRLAEARGREGDGRIRIVGAPEGVTLDFTDVTIDPVIEGIFGQDGDDTFIGSRAGDRIFGGGGDDVLRGGAGADLLAGGTGRNELDGGEGTDTASYLETIPGLSTGITVDLASIGPTTGSASGSGADGSVVVDDDLVEVENVVGSSPAGGGSGADRIAGNNLANRLEGLGGDDTLLGRGGDDLLGGGAGRNLVDGGEGTDTASYLETISGLSTGITVDLASLGPTRGSASGLGADGSPVVEDELVDVENVIGSSPAGGGSGADRIAGNDLANRLEGLDGDDTLIGRDGDDELRGDGDDDLLNGGESEDQLSGGSGNDGLDGGFTTVVLNIPSPPAGAEDDSLIGGEGRDVFVLGSYFSGYRPNFYHFPGNDIVLDFKRGEDLIDIRRSEDPFVYPPSEPGFGERRWSWGNFELFDSNDDGILGQDDDGVSIETIDGELSTVLDAPWNFGGSLTIVGVTGLTRDDFVPDRHLTEKFSGSYDLLGDDLIYAERFDDPIRIGRGDDIVIASAEKEDVISIGYLLGPGVAPGEDLLVDFDVTRDKLSWTPTFDPAVLDSNKDGLITEQDASAEVRSVQLLLPDRAPAVANSLIIDSDMASGQDTVFDGINTVTIFGVTSLGVATIVSGEVIGTDGNDILDRGDGDDYLTGFAGRDIFVFADDFGHDTVHDFDLVQDQIRIVGFATEDATIETVGADTLIRFATAEPGKDDETIILKNFVATADFLDQIVFADTLPPVPLGYLPEPTERAPIDEGAYRGAAGIGRRAFVLDADADARIIFEDEVAARKSVLGAYLVDDDGTIGDVRIVYPSIEHRSADPAHAGDVRPGGGPLSPGETVQLSDIFSGDDLEPGQEFGLFLVVGAAARYGDAVFGPGAGTLAFEDGAGQPVRLASIVPDLVFTAAAGTRAKIESNVFHTATASTTDPLHNELNAGGRTQVVSEPTGDGALRVAFEDLPFVASDKDFNDLIVTVAT